ncbi:MAG: FumA C-terminus/TtdB family hydratase beta subunit [Candidatus Margulisiibacteriota bacterium]|jgi:fumarate hydratase subunit beta
MIKKINLPMTTEFIVSLKAGEWLSLTGKIFTARDQAHLRLVNELNQGKQIFLLKEQNPILYYTGPSPKRANQIIGAAGPTTSSRMDAYTPYLIEKGIKISIGKGLRSEAVIAAIKKHQGLYLAAIGGAGAYYQNKIKKCQLIYYPELLSEAIYELEVADFLVMVAIDSQGNKF